MRKIYLLSIIALGGMGIMKGQKSSELDFKTPMPPESFQFKKRLVNNVSLYTGQPSVSIPIHTIDLDGMEIPITISYNTGGIKTDEDATFVGLGWSLSIGGEINRTNHGALDENYLMTTPYDSHSNGSAGIGFLKTPPNISGSNVPPGYYRQFCDSFTYSQIQDYLHFYQNAYYASDPLGAYESFDGRPDEFFYSMPGHSGKIMYSQKNSKFTTIPFDDIKTEYALSSTQIGSYTKKNLDFVFTLSNGYKVTFGREGIKSMYKLMTGGRLFDQTWQIGSITSPRGNSISYTYQPIEYALCTNYYPTSTLVSHNAIGSSESMKCNEVSNKDNLPKTIVFPEGKIQFNYDDRLDLMSGSKRLKEIVVYNSAGAIIKTVVLDHGYFDANYDAFTGNPNASNANVANKRLKLNSIKTIYGTNDNLNSNENYSFDYYLFDKIPSKTTTGRDHWGYFNGGVFGTPGSLSNFNPKTKSIHNWYSQIFSLKSIQYPEGGKKEFIYENHQAIPHERIERYYDEITDDRYSVKNNNLNVSGYGLNYFYPDVSNVQLPNYPSGHKVILGEEFEIKDIDTSLPLNEISLNISSDLPSKHPDYQNINREYNYVSFELQKKNGSSYENFLSLGEISKTSNSNGIIEQKLNVNMPGNALTPGFYRVAMVVYQPLLSQYSVNNINHSTAVSFKYRRKIKEDGRIGGLRIKQINTYSKDNTTPDYISQYSYLNDNEKSSGKIVSVPDYYEIVHVRTPFYTGPANDIDNGHVLALKTSNDPVRPLYKTSGSNVGYTKIIKKDINTITGEEIKESSYFTFQDPYFSDIPTSSLSRNQEPRDWQRGKLIKNQYFKNNEIIRENVYEYNGEAIEYEMDEVEEINTDLVDVSEFTCNYEPMQSKHIDLNNTWLNFVWTPTTVVPYNLYNPTGHISTTYIPYFKIYSGFDRIKSKTTSEYINGVPTLTTKENFSYFNNIYKQLEKQNTIYPDNTNSETTYKYASDLNDANMINAYMIATPLETETKNNGKTIAKSKIVYSKNNNTSSFILPTSILEYDLANPTISNEKMKYELYDSRGNIVQYSTASHGNVLFPTSIVWGYDKRQPIAKIEGATYSQIEPSIAEIVSASEKDANPSAYSLTPNQTEETLQNKLNEFRKKPELANYKISTFTYDPLIGIRSIVSHSGVGEYYQYDIANRLQSVKDGNGKTIKEYQYNLKGFVPNTNNTITYLNQANSSSFQRNNCAPNYIGGYYTYKVDEGTFFSNISQADANQKAVDDINVNGQNTANLNASCTPAPDVPCSFTPTDNMFITHHYSSFIYKPSINNVVASYTFSLPYQTSSLNWDQGVYVGSIAAGCAPSSNRTVTINSGSNIWDMTINTAGQLTLKLVSGTVVYSSTPVTFNFQYQK